jgi:hypothetical protein
VSLRRQRADDESGQAIMSGTGELHLEIPVDWMRREFGADAFTIGAWRPRVVTAWPGLPAYLRARRCAHRGTRSHPLISTKYKNGNISQNG